MMFDENSFPPHKGSLELTHNPHKDCYETVRQWYANYADRGLCSPEWISEEQKRLAFERDEVWVLHWYPNTPIGFCSLAAAELGSLLEEAKK